MSKELIRYFKLNKNSKLEYLVQLNSRIRIFYKLIYCTVVQSKISLTIEKVIQDFRIFLTDL